MMRCADRHTLAPLVLAAHGSADPRFADVITALAAMLRAQRPTLEVRIGYLDHARPDLAEVSDPGCVVVPVLLTNGFHAHIDIPSRAGGAVIAAPLGPDRRLAIVLADRLRSGGWRGETVVLAAAGSADEQALDDARTAAADLSHELGVEVTTAFIGSGQPRLQAAAAIATYLIAPGRFADAAKAAGLATSAGSSAGACVAAPLGADPILAEIILDRYDAALTTAPNDVTSLSHQR
jgi:sirohydrochlorin ferrochelatase